MGEIVFRSLDQHGISRLQVSGRDIGSPLRIEETMIGRDVDNTKTAAAIQLPSGERHAEPAINITLFDFGQDSRRHEMALMINAKHIYFLT